MAQSLGFEVEVLVRKRIGIMELKELPAGKFRRDVPRGTLECDPVGGKRLAFKEAEDGRN